MPELPEVETVRRGLAPVLEGARLVRVEQRRADLRFQFPPRFAKRLTGARIERLGRRAKYLVADLDTGESLIMHLGMSGSFRIETDASATQPGAFHMPRGKDQAHDHVVFATDGGAHVIYNDPRRFGFMDLVATEGLETCKHFGAMGVEPLGNAFNADYLAGRLKGKKAPIKAALLDQRIVAGLGNIYVCEALWRARLSPERASGSLVRANGRPTEKLEKLTGAVRDVLADAIAAGGSTLRDHRQADGTLGYFQHSFSVYDRKGTGCPRQGCGGEIRRLVQSGRSTFFCPRCQR